MRSTNDNKQNRNRRGVKSGHSVYLRVKRILDVVISALALLLLWPLMLLIALAVKIESKGSVIYVHERVGYHYRPCNIYKFRTMYMDADELKNSFTAEQQLEWNQNYKLENDPRITRVGMILRRSSADELPQLVNVLKGDLSLIGPRPVVAEELERYGENKDKFLSVKPGLSGYWQAYARNECSYEQRMRMELEYVDKANLWWDIRIFFATIGTVLRGKGAC